jgi:hypothetical protein
MKVEKREDGITLVPESEFEREALIQVKKSRIKNMEFEDSWDQKGKFLITFDDSWGR